MSRLIHIVLSLAAVTLVYAAQDPITMSPRRVITQGAAPDALFSPAVSAGGLVFVSTLTASATGPPTGDITLQTHDVLDRLGAALTAAGSSLAQVVSVNVYVRHAEDFDAMNGVYRTVFADAPPARTTVVTHIGDGALVAMSAVAVPNGAPREVLHPAGSIKSPRPYSYIVRAGGLVFLSGLVSRRGADDKVVVGSTALQVRTILENAGTLLRTAGLGYRDVVAARVFLTDESLYEAMNEEYRRVFATNPPTRATAITELMGSDAWVEISLIASTLPKAVLGAAVSPSLPLSPAIRTGPFTFLSGVIGQTTATTGIASAQTKDAFLRLGRTLMTAGLTLDDVADCTVFAPDRLSLPEVSAAFRENFPNARPAGGLVEAGLTSRAGLVELLMLAVR